MVFPKDETDQFIASWALYCFINPEGKQLTENVLSPRKTPFVQIVGVPRWAISPLYRSLIKSPKIHSWRSDDSLVLREEQSELQREEEIGWNWPHLHEQKHHQIQPYVFYFIFPYVSLQTASEGGLQKPLLCLCGLKS